MVLNVGLLRRNVHKMSVVDMRTIRWISGNQGTIEFEIKEFA